MIGTFDYRTAQSLRGLLEDMAPASAAFRVRGNPDDGYRIDVEFKGKHLELTTAAQVRTLAQRYVAAIRRLTGAPR
jgi:hypothetical protein